MALAGLIESSQLQQSGHFQQHGSEACHIIISLGELGTKLRGQSGEGRRACSPSITNGTGTNHSGGLWGNGPSCQCKSPGLRGGVLQSLNPVGQVAEEIVERLNRSSQVPGSRSNRK
jgi:hypothetical protein